MPVIKCYHEINEKWNYNYLITIDNSVFEMSNDANMPNGLNMYCGEEFQMNSNQVKEVQLGDLPKGTLIGIIRRLQEIIELSL